MLPLLTRGWLLAVVLVLAACSRGGAQPTLTTVASELGPVETVTALMAAVLDGRFDEAASLTDSQQAVLVSLAEGADAGELVDVLEDDPGVVASNFWSGYAQTLDPEVTIDNLATEAGETVEMDGTPYATVTISDPSGNEHLIYVRQDGGWTVDLMATFGPVLAERMVPRVEALLSSANANAGILIGLLKDSAPSLQVAAGQSDLDQATHQALLALIERVTRAS